MYYATPQYVRHQQFASKLLMHGVNVLARRIDVFLRHLLSLALHIN